MTTGAHLVTANQTVVQIDPGERRSTPVSAHVRDAIAAFDVEVEL